MDFQKLLEDAGLTPRSYSGRGMYGKQCLGVDSNGSGMEVIATLISLLAENEVTQSDLRELADILEDSKTDSMGRGIIMYWPNIPFEGEGNKGEEELSQEELDQEACMRFSDPGFALGRKR